MHVTAIYGSPRFVDGDLLDQLLRLQSKVLGTRFSWNVSAEEGREIDDYHLLAPTYITALPSRRDVIGCTGPIPATEPTMLETVFPQLLHAAEFNTHPCMIESSRFCADTGCGEGKGRPTHDATLATLAGIIEWCLLNGYTEIVTATDVRFERILKRVGWPMRRLGELNFINETMSVAGILHVKRAVFQHLLHSFRESVGQGASR